jgi:hypothetical protein
VVSKQEMDGAQARDNHFSFLRLLPDSALPLFCTQPLVLSWKRQYELPLCFLFTHPLAFLQPVSVLLCVFLPMAAAINP